MQLVAYGAQDIYLTGNSQITFWKVVYRRHTNFSMESIEQTFNGQVDFGRRITATISRNGDLITKVYFQVDLPAVASNASDFAWTKNIGNVMIDNVELDIGGQRIDKHYGDWMHIWNSLTLPVGQLDGYNNMIGNVSSLYTAPTGGTAAKRLYVPFFFWFNRNPGLALPLIALQYHEVKLTIELRAVSQLYTGTPDATPSISTASLWVDYVYLDTDERRRFAQVSHEYLIEQLQFTGGESVSNTSNKIRLNFNHPVKELVWVVQPDTNVVVAQNEHTNYTDALGGAGADPLVDAKLQLNGHDRFATRQAAYFGLVQPYQHHTNTPDTGIYVYSFALSPEQHQPSGSANMSRIDNATLNLNIDSTVAAGAEVRIYAVNYNVLRIMSGMGGLAYSN